MIWILHIRSVYLLPGLTSINTSSKKRESCDDFSIFIKNDMDRKMKRLVNPTIVREKFSVFAEMISEELKCLSRRHQICTKKLMYDVLHIDIVKKFDDK